MGICSSKSSDSPGEHEILKDPKNLRRKRAFFIPLAENRRLQVLDYLIISGNAKYNPSAEAFKQSLDSFDFHLSESQILDNFSDPLLNPLKAKSLFERLVSNEKSNGYVVYFCGKITEEEDPCFVISSQNDSDSECDDSEQDLGDQKQNEIGLSSNNNQDKKKCELYHIREMLSTWRRHKFRESKHLLLIIDSKQASNLQLCPSAHSTSPQFPPPLHQYEDHFGIPWKGSQFILRKDPTLSIITSSCAQSQEDNRETSQTRRDTYSFHISSHREIKDDMLEKYPNVTPFTSILCEYLQGNNTSSNLAEIACKKGYLPSSSTDNSSLVFFGFEVKTYLDFGVFWWTQLVQMMNQLDVNYYVSNGISDPKESSSLAFLESRLLHPSPQGEYFGFLQNKLVDREFANPRLFPNQQRKSISIITDENEELSVQDNLSQSSIRQLTKNKLYQNCMKENQITDCVSMHQQQQPNQQQLLDISNESKLSYPSRRYYGYQEYQGEHLETYEGYWKSNMFSQFGCYRFSSGVRYEGEYFKGKKHGFGVFYGSQGERYAGQFVDNEINGIGVLYQKDKQVYVGNFLNGKRHGFGEVYVSNEHDTMLKYGMWSNNMQNGKSQLTFLSLPYAEMDIFYTNDRIHGDVFYNISEEQEEEDRDRQSPRLLIFKSIWFNDRRVSEYSLLSPEMDDSESDSILEKYAKVLERLEYLLYTFVYPIIAVINK